MNLMLLGPADLSSPDTAVITGKRADHVRTVLRKGVGDEVLVGVRDGQVGRGRITRLDARGLELTFVADLPPPPPSPVVLVLALPRPPMLRRALQTAATFGVKEIHLLHARRVEKSYWASASLEQGDLDAQLVLGLEQARDTVVPRVWQHNRFRPFVEDELPALIHQADGLLADGAAVEPCPTSVTNRTILTIGPEGGFIPFERDMLQAAGLRPVRLGPRPLRVDVAVAALLGRLV